MRANKIKFFDSHLHIIDPRFPLYENQGFIPKPFTTTDYLSRLQGYNVTGGAVVSGSFQKQDHTYIVDALDKLGPNFVGVIQLFADTPDNTILALNKKGICAVRFNLRRGGSENITKIRYFADRIYELAKWHVEIYVDSSALGDLYSTLIALPSVSIDHLGLNKAGIHTLLKLAGHGVKVKATGFARVDFNPATVIRNIYSANPNALMFGTDLPSTRAPRRYDDSDLLMIPNILDDVAAAKVLFQNAHEFYLQKSA